MRVRFKTSIGTAQVSYVDGQIVRVARFPQEWQEWLERGLVEVMPEDVTATTEAVPMPEVAVVPRRRGRRHERAAALAG